MPEGFGLACLAASGYFLRMLRRPAVIAMAFAVAISAAPATAGAKELSAVTAPEAAAALKMSTGKTVSKGKSISRGVRPLRAVQPLRDFVVTSGFRGPHRRNHEGVDLGAPRRTAVYAVMNGRVTFAGWDGAYGRKIMVDHGRGIVTTYAHLDSMSVEVGDRVKIGHRIGRVGTSGRTTGPHLHFEVHKNGVLSDPSRWFKALGIGL